MAKDAKGHGSDKRGEAGGEKRTATGAPWDYGKTVGRFGGGVPSNPHPDSAMGRAMVKSGEGVQLQLGLGERKVASIAAEHGVPTGQLSPGGRHGYSPEAVNAAIASSNRAGRRIGGREARMIHALLKGRG